MEKCLKITKIIKNKNRIEYDYEAEKKWQELLNLEEKMFVEYDVNIEEVPESLAIVPLLCNILPISWVFDLTIKIDTMDQEFYECIPNLKKGYSDMYPMMKMLGNLEVNKIEENSYDPTKTMTLFSGGVDAFNTLFQHIEEKPTLMTIWGADIKLSDQAGWENVKKQNILVANQYNLEYSFVKTNFRTFINYGALSSYVSQRIDGEWWHEFQHGIGILGLVAPIAYLNQYGIVYIASSFTADNKIHCASDPTIDNYLRFGNCKVIHDGYEYNRQDKIHNICNYLDRASQKEIMLRVCWKTSGGNNCCECEKCYRTILGIIAERKNPSDFGFEWTPEKRKKMMKELPKLAKYNPWHWYKDIQKRFIENYSIQETPNDLKWFRNLKIRDEKPNYLVVSEKIISKIKRMLKKIIT